MPDLQSNTSVRHSKGHELCGPTPLLLAASASPRHSRLGASQVYNSGHFLGDSAQEPGPPTLPCASPSGIKELRL
jgi:hypothetical protein